MKVVILDKGARNNIALFQHLVHHRAQGQKHHFKVARKVYEALIHVQTGQLRFKELEKRCVPDANWRLILIQLRPGNRGAFEVLQPGCNEMFECAILEPRAYRLLSETMRILNQLSYDPKRGGNPFWVLHHVARIELVVPAEEQGSENLVHSAWHTCDRKEAEHLLRNQPLGTYLFRKDIFAKRLEDSISAARNIPVVCITLAFCNWYGEICEATVVHFDGEWMIFDDDVCLRGPRYSSTKDLLASMQVPLTNPLTAA